MVYEYYIVDLCKQAWMIGGMQSFVGGRGLTVEYNVYMRNKI